MPPHFVSPTQPVTVKPEGGGVERRVGFSWEQGSSFPPCPLYSAPPFQGAYTPATGPCRVPAVRQSGTSSESQFLCKMRIMALTLWVVTNIKLGKSVWDTGREGNV